MQRDEMPPQTSSSKEIHKRLDIYERENIRNGER